MLNNHGLTAVPCGNICNSMVPFYVCIISQRSRFVISFRHFVEGRNPRKKFGWKWDTGNCGRSSVLKLSFHSHRVKNLLVQHNIGLRWPDVTDAWWPSETPTWPVIGHWTRSHAKKQEAQGAWCSAGTEDPVHKNVLKIFLVEYVILATRCQLLLAVF